MNTLKSKVEQYEKLLKEGRYKDAHHYLNGHLELTEYYGKKIDKWLKTLTKEEARHFYEDFEWLKDCLFQGLEEKL